MTPAAVPWLGATFGEEGAAVQPLLGLAATVILLWLFWVAWLEPRWVQVVAYRFRPGLGPSVFNLSPAPARPGNQRDQDLQPPDQRVRIPQQATVPDPHGLPGQGRQRVRIAHLTDLHAPVYQVSHRSLLRYLKQAQPDLIVFTGDLADGPHQPADGGVDLMAALARRWPVYLVPGNHDHLAGWPGLQRRLAAAGVHVLVNEGRTVGIAGTDFFLAGVDDPHTGRDRLDEALKGCPAGRPVILLAHAPSAPLRDQAARRQVALVLAGHTHGGQVRPPLLGALWIPGQGWFPRYDRGWFLIGGTYWYISAGLGTPRPWIRWRCRPEIAVIDVDLTPPQGTS